MQILNYWYLLNEGNYVGRFSDYPVVICDEADTLESLLTSFVELRLSMSHLKNLDIQPPKYKTTTAYKGLESWQDWASTEAYLKITNRVKQLEGHVSSINPNASMSVQEACLVRELTQFKRLQAKLETFSNHVDESWIFQETAGKRANGWKFQPTWLTPELSNEFFFRHGERFVLMSATLLPKPILAQTLGLSSNEVEVIELPSTFPVSNRPVLLDPVADMSHKTFAVEMPSLLAEIKRLVDKHRGNKGVIHTVSYKLNQVVMSLKNRRFITHNSRDKDIALKRFADSKDGILVSPSSTRGVDLPDDECRFIIIAKAPFQSLGDKLVKSRVYGAGGLGAFWYRAMCAQNIVQASGRGVRHQNDHCTTYVLDKQACGLIVDNQSLFPRYWMEAVDYL
jgi:Rad3-related DNA helicase